MLLYLLATLVGLGVFGLMSFGALRYALFEAKKGHLIGREERLIALLRSNTRSNTESALEEELRGYALVTHEGNLFHVHNLDGSLFFPHESAALDWIAGSVDCSQPVYRTVVYQQEKILVRCHNIVINGRSAVLHIGGSLAEQDEILHIYRRALLLLMPVVLILSIGSGYFLSRRALRPVDRMTRAALDIGISNLSQRLPVPAAKDEIQHLAVTWNQLLARLESAVSRLSQLSADASHDIRTSITVILATAQLSLQRKRSEEQYRQDLERIVVECHTGATLLDAMLSLARSGNFMHTVAFSRIDLCELAVSGCRRVESLAESSGIILDWRVPLEPVFVQGDELLLQRLLGILLDNAIRYTPKDGEILVEISVSEQSTAMRVRDTGIGMTDDVQRRVFERYYQADLRERKKEAGNGLGLSIARWIVEAHGASIHLESAPALGTEFQIVFPALEKNDGSFLYSEFVSSNELSRRFAGS